MLKTLIKFLVLAVLELKNDRKDYSRSFNIKDRSITPYTSYILYDVAYTYIYVRYLTIQNRFFVN